MFEPDANQILQEDQLVDELAEAIYLVARQATRADLSKNENQTTQHL